MRTTWISSIKSSNNVGSCGQASERNTSRPADRPAQDAGLLHHAREVDLFSYGPQLGDRRQVAAGAGGTMADLTALCVQRRSHRRSCSSQNAGPNQNCPNAAFDRQRKSLKMIERGCNGSHRILQTSPSHERVGGYRIAALKKSSGKRPFSYTGFRVVHSTKRSSATASSTTTTG
jgi:hypothetical protein